MKKYSSVYMRVINVNANDIIATSDSRASIGRNVEDEGDILVGERRGWDEF